jgi:hypothetical protein
VVSFSFACNVCYPSLEFREGDPVKDHGLFGKTYLDALRWEGRRYQTLYLPPWNYITYVALNYSRAMGIAFNDAFIKVIKTIVMFVMIVNEWIKEKIIMPVATVLLMVWNVLMEIIRAVRGDDLYQPVVSQTMDETS